MRDERVPVSITSEKQQLVDAYLAEIVSTTGHSGSPVFACHSTKPRSTFFPVSARLIGLVSGHWTVVIKTDSSRPGVSSVAATSSGLAVVTPAEYIAEAIVSQQPKT